MKFIKDEEIDLTRQDDLLNGQSYAQALRNAISAGTPNNEAFVIGLFGEWGSGKSSIIKTAQSLLRQDKRTKIKFITYDAWKYAHDSFRRMFLFQIQKDLGFTRQPLMEKFYSNTAEDLVVKSRFNHNKCILWGIPILFTIIFIVSNFWDSLRAQQIQFASFCLTALSLLFSCWQSFFDTIKVTQNTPLLFAPEQFEECFDEMTTHVLKKRSVLERIFKWIVLDTRKSNFDKIVIIIDNIDRCDSKTAYELLTAIKSFLLKDPNLVFVVPTDDRMLCDHLAHCFDYSHKLSEEFFRKIFNVEIRIKPLEEIELFDFTNKLNQKYRLHFSPDAINIIANEFATNPRRIIQFFNNVLLELEILKKHLTDTELLQGQDAVCKLLIIREEWPAYYKLILKNSSLLYASDFEDKNHLFNSNELHALNTFLKQTSAFNTIHDYSLIEKIISNSAVFDNIPGDTKTAIKEQNKSKLSEFILLADDNLSFVVSYIEEELQKNIARQTWHTAVPAFFRALLLANNIKTIPAPLNDRIRRVIENKLSYFIMNLNLKADNNVGLLTKYLNDLNAQHKFYLTKELINILSENITKAAVADPLYLWLYEQLLTGITAKSVFSKNKQLFAKWYSTFKNTLEDLKLTDLDNFVSEDVLSYIIEHVEEDNDSFLEDFIYIGKHILLKPEHFDSLFKQLNSFYSSYAGPEDKSISERLKKSIPILSILNTKKPISELQIFVKNMFEIYNKPVRYSYQTHMQTYSLIKDNLDDNALKTDVIRFLALVYKSTNNSIETMSYFKQILEQDPDSLDQILETLRSVNIESNISPIKDLIITSHLFTENHVYWLERLIKRTYTTGDSVLSDQELSNEIDDIIHEIGKTPNSQKRNNLNKLLDFIYDNREKIKVTQAVIEALKTENKDTIIKLSETIRPLALSKICENISDYKDLQDILQSIATHGDKEHIKKLMVFIRSEVAKDDKKTEMLDLYRMIPQEKLSKPDQDKMKPYLQELEADSEES